jgi:ketosteroid isomerase-like protein
MFRKSLLTAAILAGLTLNAAAQDAPKPVDLAAEYQGLINTERAFAKKSVDSNPKEAFLAYIADDAILFAPYPGPGKELWQKLPVPQYSLDWWPTQADISRSADLGWTTGPFIVAFPDGKKIFGFFSTVWRKQADSTWRFVTDMGATMPEASARGGEPGPLDAAKLEKFTAPTDPKEADAALMAADTALGESAPKGLEEAYKPLLADNVRLMRQEHAPFVGKEAAALRLSEEKGMTFSSRPSGGGSSKAGDLGYVYGTYERRGERLEGGSYLRIWRREPGDTWKLALEVLSPRPV